MVKFISLSTALFALSMSVAALAKNVSKGLKEDYYYIYIDEDGLEKRSENGANYLDSLLDEINNLIVGNKGTYKNKNKLFDLNSKISSSELVKRDQQSDSENIFTAPVYSYNGDSVYYSYLSPEVAEMISSLPNIAAVEPNIKIEYTEHYNKSHILKETGWSDLSVEKSPFHLSLISQGTVNEKFIKYDENFYYPSSAGKDVDMFFFESSFNFNHPEFSNERKLQCINATTFDQIHLIDDLTVKSDDNTFHGEQVTDVAAGLKYGVAKNANLYGVVIENVDFQIFNSALAYIKENLLRPNKAVFNMSFTIIADLIPINHWPFRAMNHAQELINEITDMGGIFVASAGNDNLPVKYIFKNRKFVPCTLDNVICVGGVNSENMESLVDNQLDTIFYKRHNDSNYGELVDLYAPYTVKTEFYDNDNKNIVFENEGTSFSSPIVAGVIASIISDNKDKTYNHDEMLKYLRSIGHKGVVSNIPEDKYNTEYDLKTSEHTENVFVSNGKHTVYSMNGKYTSADGKIEGCGVNAGNRVCSDHQCCSEKSICTYNQFKCKVHFGCQEKFGACY